MRNSKINKKKSGEVTSVLGKRGGRENAGSVDAEATGQDDGADKSKKVCAAGMGEDGKKDDKEATGPGAPGPLVGAKDGARQGP